LSKHNNALGRNTQALRRQQHPPFVAAQFYFSHQRDVPTDIPKVEILLEALPPQASIKVLFLINNAYSNLSRLFYKNTEFFLQR
jgi:hypothetical protein